jgi:hypothetical protein
MCVLRIDTDQGARVSQEVSFSDGILTVTAVVDSMEIYLAYKERYERSEWRASARTTTAEESEKRALKPVTTGGVAAMILAGLIVVSLVVLYRKRLLIVKKLMWIWGRKK